MRNVEFPITGGNTSLEQARIICVASTHTEAEMGKAKSPRQARQEIFGRVRLNREVFRSAKKGDIILTEGNQAGEVIPWILARIFYGSPRGTITMGWDDEKANKQISQQFKEEDQEWKKKREAIRIALGKGTHEAMMETIHQLGEGVQSLPLTLLNEL